eukprot:2070889-Prymnesium_polylepis.1
MDRPEAPRQPRRASARAAAEHVLHLAEGVGRVRVITQQQHVPSAIGGCGGAATAAAAAAAVRGTVEHPHQLRGELARLAVCKHGIVLANGGSLDGSVDALQKHLHACDVRRAARRDLFAFHKRALLPMLQRREP